MRRAVILMRLIDANNLMDHACRDRLDSRELIWAMIENAPTVDAVEVVRCAKCKHWKYESGVGMACMKDFDTFGVGFPKFGHEYCSDGKQKNGEQDEIEKNRRT